VSVSFTFIAETSSGRLSGMSPGSASTVTSRLTCSMTPPSLAPGASSKPISSTHDRGLDRDVHAHAQEVDVDRLAVHRMAAACPEEDRGLGAVEVEVDDLPGVREHATERQHLDLQRHGILAAAVDDAGIWPARRRRRASREPSASRREAGRTVVSPAMGRRRTPSKTRPGANLGRAMGMDPRLVLLAGALHLLMLLLAGVLLVGAARAKPTHPWQGPPPTGRRR